MVRRAVGVANRSHHGGAFRKQVEAIQASSGSRTAVVVRTSDYPEGKSSTQTISALRRKGGRNLVLSTADLRALIALRGFAPPAPAEVIAAWRADRQPIARLTGIRELLGLDDLEGEILGEPEPEAPPPAAAAAAPAPEPAPRPAPVRPRSATVPPKIATGDLLIGTAMSFKSEPVTLPLQQLCRHAVVLGVPGSGKTTLALRMIEEAVERDVAILLVDRKGDLAGYARPGWWTTPSGDADADQRKLDLADRVDVRLFTPGSAGGRPLAFDVAPQVEGLPSHEQARMVQYAADALAGMMRLGDTGGAGARRAILRQALQVLAEAGGARRGIDALVKLIDERDDELVARVNRFDDKLFRTLVQELETLRVQNEDLLDPAAEQLTADRLLGRSADGRTPLTIVSTKFLGDNARIQFWVARMLVELARWTSRQPSDRLQALLLFDEADLYLPAGMAKPASKEPMQELLRRARAGGVGVVLASQSPGDFDYRVRDLVTTWFVGKVGDRRSIEKMKPLFEAQRAGVAGKLPQLEAHRFFLMAESQVRALATAMPLLHTEQLPEAEILALAARQRGA